MLLELLKGKIHRATVTQAELDYVGSITVDRTLLEQSGILEYEKVQIVDVNNGSRFETYTIAGEPNSGVICLNGAAARCVSVGTPSSSWPTPSSPRRRPATTGPLWSLWTGKIGSAGSATTRLTAGCPTSNFTLIQVYFKTRRKKSSFPWKTGRLLLYFWCFLSSFSERSPRGQSPWGP